jgi:SAM-dependent methyltransferase
VTRAEAGGDWALVRGDMRRLPFGAGAFHVVTSFFTSFGYFGESEDDAVISEAARVLRRGGSYVLDTANRAAVLARPPGDEERETNGYRIREERSLEDRGRRVVKRVDVTRVADGTRVASYAERVTLYAPDEIRARLDAQGFRALLEWGDYEGTGFDAESSPRHLLVTRRER